MMGDRDNFRDDFPYFSIKTCGPSFEPSWRDDSNDLVGGSNEGSQHVFDKK